MQKFLMKTQQICQIYFQFPNKCVKDKTKEYMCVCASLSQAVVVDRTVYISGQLGLDVASGQLVDGGVQAQAKQVRLTRPDGDDEEDGGGGDHGE